MRTKVVLTVLGCVSLFVLPLAARATTYEVTTVTQLNDLLGTGAGAAHEGDRIHINRGTYRATSAGGWKIRKTLEIFGDGPGNPFDPLESGDPATWLQPYTENDPVLVVDTNTGADSILYNVYIHDLSIGYSGVPAGTPGAYGISCINPAGKNLVNFRLKRVNVFRMGDDGIYLDGYDTGTGAVVEVDIEDCSSAHNRGHGLRMENAMKVMVQGGGFTKNDDAGASFTGCLAVHLVGVTFQRNQQEGEGWVHPQLFLESSHDFLVTGGHFEAFTDNSYATPAISLSGCLGGSIVSSWFSPSTTNIVGSTGIKLGEGTKSIFIGSNTYANVDNLVEIADATSTTSCTVLPQSIYSSTNGATSTMLIPTASDRGHVIYPPTTNTSNLTSGIEFPRLSSTQRDAITSGNRREGLAIYNATKHRMQHWDGNRWLELAGGVVGSEVDRTGATAITAPQSSTNILTSVPAGTYRVSVYAITKTAMNKGHIFRFYWTDGSARSLALEALNTAAGSLRQESFLIYVSGGDLAWDSVLTQGTTMTGSCDLRVRVEAMP